MNDEATRYPLAWPLGWKRSLRGDRRRADFGKTSSFVTADGHKGRSSKKPLSVADAIARLSGELTRLGATNEILSTNVETRLDGLPRSNQAEPYDPGAAVYFRLKKLEQVLACDKWDRVADNIAALAQHIDALRRIDRYGVGTREQAFAGYAALPASTDEWWTVLGLGGDVRRVPRAQALDAVEDAYRLLAKTHHPDAGGSHDAMARLNAARAAAKKELTR